jgi:adenine/guanine phosphoribosyltransferase-like PRPP-binding protein
VSTAPATLGFFDWLEIKADYPPSVEGPFALKPLANFAPEDEEDAPRRTSACPSYTRDVFSPETFPGIVDWVAAQVAAGPSIPGARRYGAIAGSGHSGVLVAAAVGYKLRLPVIAVRKVEEDGGFSHDGSDLNACLCGDESYVIVDDLISSGSTIQRIVRFMAKTFPKAVPSLVLLYHDTFGDDTVTVSPDGETRIRLPIIRRKD